VGKEEEDDYVPLTISPRIMVGIQCPRCPSLLGMLEDYLGVSW
jgi:hypothetical protein